jgi:2'-5' RNA ligase
MKSIRSFIAIPLDPEVSRAAVRLIERVREPGDGIKWVPTDNLHLTLKFLGDVHNTEVPQVCAVIRAVCKAHAPFELKFSGTGGLPAIDRARVLYAGVADPSGTLTEIVMALEHQLAALGFKPEPRDYKPHLTLGRAKARKAGNQVMERLRQESDADLGSMFVTEVQLIASFLDKAGPTYQVMDTVEL